MGQRISLTAFGSLKDYKYVVGAVALGYYAVVRIAQKRAEKRAENFPALFYSEEGEPGVGSVGDGRQGLKTIAVVAVALVVGTYAVVKIAQKRAEKKKPPTPRRYSGGSVGEAGNNLGCGRVSREEEPWCLSPGELERWYNENIQRGTDAFAMDCRSAIDSVVRHVHRNCKILDFDIDKVVKGGSLGKGTMVKDLSDVDLIAFINPPNLSPIATIGLPEYKRKLAVVIQELYTALMQQSFVYGVSKNEFLVKFNIKVRSRCLSVDFLPTSNNSNCAGNGGDMLSAMLQLRDMKDKIFYSASFAEQELNFVGNHPGYVKELIRLVKYWAHDFLPEKLQKSYRLELITIHLWEKAGKPVRFSKAQGLKNVLQVLTRLTALRVTSWSGSNMYNDKQAQTAIIQRGMQNPIVLDPINPTDNVCLLYQQGNNGMEIASAAEQTLRTNLLRNVTVYQGWRG